jgi:hypothetical protein
MQLVKKKAMVVANVNKHFSHEFRRSNRFNGDLRNFAFVPFLKFINNLCRGISMSHGREINAVIIQVILCRVSVVW